MRICLVLLLLSLWACQQKPKPVFSFESSRQAISDPVMPELSEADSLYLLLDTLNATPLQKQVIQMVMDSGFYFAKTIPQLLHKKWWYNLHPFNRDSLIEIIHHEEYTKDQAKIGRTTSHLFLFNARNLECVATDRLEGDHYGHEEIEIEDWDGDGTPEIMTYHTYDVQSVPVTYYSMAVAKVDQKQKKFNFIFGTELDSYDCAMGVERGLRTKTRYRFVHPHRIKLTTYYYSFPCGETSIIGDVDWENGFKSSRLDSTKVSFQNWNARKGFFE